MGAGTGPTRTAALDIAVEAVTGAFGGVMGRTVAFPFETLKQTRTRDPNASLLDVISEPSTLYRGLPVSAFEAWVSKGTQFLAVTRFRTLYTKYTGKKPTSVAIAVLFGYVADLCALFNVIPLENVLARMQADPVGFSWKREVFCTEFAKKCLQQLRVYLVLALKPGLELGLFDVFKNLYLKRLAASMTGAAAGSKVVGVQSIPPFVAFILGAAARFVATLTVYPVIRLKTLANIRKGNDQPSYLKLLLDTLRNDGVAGLYTGVQFELSRGVTQSAVMFLIVESLRSRVRNVITNADVVGSARGLAVAGVWLIFLRFLTGSGTSVVKRLLNIKG